jgi:hypothetical protein
LLTRAQAPARLATPLREAGVLVGPEVLRDGRGVNFLLISQALRTTLWPPMFPLRRLVGYPRRSVRHVPVHAAPIFARVSRGGDE